MHRSFIILLTALTLAGSATAADSFSMENYRGSHRPLVVFAPDDSHGYYRQTADTVDARRDGFERRDMILISVFRNTGSSGSAYLSRENADALRRQYDIKPDEFRLLLIGKDGGVKLESDQPADMQAIFQRIDGMPMRQREMRQSR